MKKLECEHQEHFFQDQVKQALAQRGIVIAIAENSESDFSFCTVNHILPKSEDHLSTAYDELCLIDLERQHLQGICDKIADSLPFRVGEVFMRSESHFGGDGGFGKQWYLKTIVRVRPFISPVRPAR